MRHLMNLWLVAGSPSSLLWVLAFAFLALASCFGGLAAWSFVRTMKESKSSFGSWIIQKSGKTVRLTALLTPDGVKPVITRISLVLLIGATCWVLGYLSRDHQLVSNQQRYQEVLVAQRYDDRHFLLRPEGMKTYKFDFDTPQDFEPGQKMTELNYEQRFGVKRLIRADFCPAHCDGNGRRKIYREELTHVGE